LDLFEGRERFGLTIPDDGDDPDAILQGALAKLNSSPGLQDYVARNLADTKARQVPLPKHLGLHTSTDLGRNYAVYILDGCRLEQVGYFETDGRLIIATSVFDHLSPTGQAGFLLHESLYRLTRALAGADDSASTRKLVAEFLSTSINTHQLVADVEKSLNSDAQINHFAALRYRRDAKFSVRLDSVCRPFPQPVDFLDFEGKTIQSLYFPADSTQEILGERSIAQLTTMCGGGFRAFEVLYDGKVVHQAFDDPGSARVSVFVSWR
jgi:hypothetical protein